MDYTSKINNNYYAYKKRSKFLILIALLSFIPVVLYYTTQFTDGEMTGPIPFFLLGFVKNEPANTMEDIINLICYFLAAGFPATIPFLIFYYGRKWLKKHHYSKQTEYFDDMYESNLMEDMDKAIKEKNERARYFKELNKYYEDYGFNNTKAKDYDKIYKLTEKKPGED